MNVDDILRRHNKHIDQAAAHEYSAPAVEYTDAVAVLQDLADTGVSIAEEIDTLLDTLTDRDGVPPSMQRRLEDAQHLRALREHLPSAIGAELLYGGGYLDSKYNYVQPQDYRVPMVHLDDLEDFTTLAAGVLSAQNSLATPGWLPENFHRLGLDPETHEYLVFFASSTKTPQYSTRALTATDLVMLTSSWRWMFVVRTSDLHTITVLHAPLAPYVSSIEDLTGPLHEVLTAARKRIAEGSHPDWPQARFITPTPE